MSTQLERSTTTRAKIMAVARAAFVRDGYGGTSLERIAAEAGLTKGAVYHHYESKEAVFAAVFRLVSEQAIEAASRRTRKVTPARAQIKAAAAAWLEAVEAHEARTILLDLGPQALGFAHMRALEEAITLPPLVDLLETVITDEDLGGELDVLLIARLINAALAEIALLRQEPDGRAPTLDVSARAIAGIIDGLLTVPKPA